MSIKQYLESKKNIQQQLIDLLSNEHKPNESSYKDFIKSLEINKVREDKKEFKSFLCLLSHISNNYHRSSTFFDSIEKILLSFSNEFKQFLTKDQIYRIFHKNKRILLSLIDNKILILDQKIVDDIIKHETYQNYFINEIKPFISDDLYQKIQKENENLEIKDFKYQQKCGENELQICKMIREDMITELIQYISQTNTSIDTRISRSIFETNPFLLKSDKVTLAEYSAFFGSIQIFKYLKVNNIILTPALWLYAIHGQNAEIIEILKESKIQPPNSDYVQCLEESIKCHNDAFARYFLDNHFPSKMIRDKSSLSPSIIITCSFQQI